MKVMLVVPWDQERGGVTSVAENLALHLKNRGHEVLFFHPGKTVVLRTTRTSLGFSGVQLRLIFPFMEPRPFVSAVAFPFLFPVIFLQLIWFLRRHHVDIVNLHFPIDNFFYFSACRRLLSFRLVTSLHGSDAFDLGRPKDNYSRVFKFLLRASDLIVLPSDSYRKALVEIFPDVEGKTVFIHNGVNPAQFALPEDGQAMDPENRYILCIANFRVEKGIDVLIEASMPLLKCDRSLNLVLVGDGPLRTEFEALASSLGIRNQIQFLGSKGSTEVVKLLHGCELLVLPSKAESFGIVVIEAFACKKPVVATKVGGIPEVIEHGISGILVEPDDAGALTAGIRDLLGNSDRRRILGQNGYSRVMERFCLSHTGAAYEAAFASLSRLPSRPSPYSPSNVSTDPG